MGHSAAYTFLPAIISLAVFIYLILLFKRLVEAVEKIEKKLSDKTK